MKKLTILAVVLVLLLSAGSVAAKPARGCVVELGVFAGFHAPVPGLRVFVDTDQAWTLTTEDGPTVITFDVNPQVLHVINVLEPGRGVLWSMGYRCVNPGVTPVEAYLTR